MVTLTKVFSYQVLGIVLGLCALLLLSGLPGNSAWADNRHHPSGEALPPATTIVHPSGGSSSRPNSQALLIVGLLREAKEHQRHGNMAKAWECFNKARAHSPGLVEPIWLREDFPKVGKAEPTREDLLILGRQSVKADVKKLLESLLRDNPTDKEVREVLLVIAKKEGNSAEINRHTSVLYEPPKVGWLGGGYERWLFLLATILVIFWQGLELWKDLVKSNSETPPDKENISGKKKI